MSWSQHCWDESDRAEDREERLYREGLAAMRKREPWLFDSPLLSRSDRDLPGYDEREFGKDEPDRGAA